MSPSHSAYTSASKGAHNSRGSSADPADFTIGRYRTLLEFALNNYVPRTFHSYEVGDKCFIVRHDVDFSLNRAVALAGVESEFGISAHYLIDPHSVFYNLAELSQVGLLHNIMELGHTVGLHFDANFHDLEDESDLDVLVRKEAEWIEFLIGTRPSTLSFHNPSELHLQWQADSYGELINCYSTSLMESLSYISDSNGYWRFRQLQEVLLDGSEPGLQILIHPGWWQEMEMPPRQRVFRSSFGRARATMANYDQSLDHMARTNVDGLPEGFGRLRSAIGSRFLLLDYLWNEGHLATLFVELWRLHEVQLNRLCRAKFRKQWCIPAHQVDALFASDGASLDGWNLFEIVFGQTWESAVDIESSQHHQWVEVRNQLIDGREVSAPIELQRGCTYLATVVTALATWGLQQPFEHDGIEPLDRFGLPTVAPAAGSFVEELDEGVANAGRGSSGKLLGEWERLKTTVLNGRTPNEQ